MNGGNHVNAQNVQTEMDRTFLDVINRMVTRMYPNATQEDRLDAEGELVGLAQCIMLQTIHHISGKGTPWENGR